MVDTGAPAESGRPKVPAVLAGVALLERFYGPLPAPPTDPFRYYVWDALSAQTTAAKRDAAFAAMQRIPALTPDSLFRASRTRLVAAVTLAGPYLEQRVQALLGGGERFRRHPPLAALIRGPIARACRAASLLPTIGEGATHRMLLFGGGHCVMPTDRGIQRMAGRLGWADDVARPGGRARVRRAIESGLPADARVVARAALYLRHHAQHSCSDEPHCQVCPLARACPGRRS